jgi:hypothetical protein
MPRFIIERNMPGVGDLTGEQLREAAQTSNRVLRELGPDVQWLQSYVSDDRITCVYIASDEKLVREHARRSGFPADRILEVRTVIDPTTAEMTTVTA